MKKILLLGASGQLGREWQHFFADRKADDLHVIPYTSGQLDITDFALVEHEIKEQQADIIVNCAAYTNVDKAEEEREKAQLVNAKSVKNVAHVCNELNIKLVHFSTDYIFAGDEKDQTRFPYGYPEDHEADPVNWYGKTKWEGEQAVRASGCDHLIIRVSWLCGAHGSNFVTAMLRLAQERDELNIVADQLGSPTFTRNLVQNTFKLIEEEQEGTYHLTSNGIISWADFAAAIFGMADIEMEIHEISTDEYPTTANRPRFSKLHCDKIERIQGVHTISWQQGLQSLINQIKQH